MNTFRETVPRAEHSAILLSVLMVAVGLFFLLDCVLIRNPFNAFIEDPDMLILDPIEYYEQKQKLYIVK